MSVPWRTWGLFENPREPVETWPEPIRARHRSRGIDLSTYFRDRLPQRTPASPFQVVIYDSLQALDTSRHTWLEDREEPDLSASIELYGERFYWKHDDVLGRVLAHRHWSLIGHGQTDAEAVSMLIERIAVVAQALLPTESEPSPTLDPGGKAMREYLRRVVRDRKMA